MKKDRQALALERDALAIPNTPPWLREEVLITLFESEIRIEEYLS